MYKNTVIQQKDLAATCTVAEAMAPFTGQIRTSQEKKSPCPNRQHLQMAERGYVEFFFFLKEPA